MATDAASLRRRFEDRLAFYLNGTLPAGEREFVERYVRENPDATADVDVWREFGASLTQSATEVAPDIGLAKLQQRMRAAPRQPSHSLLERIVAWLRPLATPRAFTFASLLVLVQAGAIIALLLRPGVDTDQTQVVATRSLGKPSTAGVSLRVKFNSAASMQAVNSALGAVNAKIVAGPVDDTRYLLKLPQGAAPASAIDQLKASGVIAEIAVVAAPEAQSK